MESFYGGRPGRGLEIYHCVEEAPFSDLEAKHLETIPTGGYGISNDGWLFKLDVNRKPVLCGNVLLDRSSAAHMFSMEVPNGTTDSAIVNNTYFPTLLKGGLIFKVVEQ